MLSSTLKLAPCLTMLLAIGGMNSGGCPQIGNLSSAADPNALLAGLWSLTRSDIQLTCTWTVSGGGEVVQSWPSTALQPLDPADFPSELKPLVQQWNNGLAELNAHLNEAFPSSIIVAFPQYGVMSLAAPTSPALVIEGSIDSTAAYIFLADLSGDKQGDAQGGGAVLQAATLQGQFNRTTMTTTGYAARTLLIVGSGVGGDGLVLTVQIRINYTGRRTGDAAP